MDIKFESEDNSLLHELHKFIYEQDQDFMIDEHYEMTPGANKEPVVTTLVATILTEPVLNFIKIIVKEFIQLKIEKAKEETKQLKDTHRHREKLLKIYFKNGGKWEMIDPEKLGQLRIDD